MKGNNTVGFGVIGATSHVAQVGVIPAIEGANNSRIVAMSSRTFRENDLSTSGVRLYRDYRDLLEDAEVDAVYVALPNHLHHKVVIEAITSKKHVLCEKPMAISGKDLQEMRGAAQQNRVALAEAYMTAYHPRHIKALGLCRDESFGEVQSIYSSFSGRLEPLSGYRLDPMQGGGSLWDIGIYAFSPVLKILGSQPKRLITSFTKSRSLIDLRTATTIEFEGDRNAFVFTSFVSAESQDLKIIGENLSLEVKKACTPSSADTQIVQTDRFGKVTLFESEPISAYLAMIMAFSKHILEGTPLIWSVDDTATTLRIVERLVSEIGKSSDQVGHVEVRAL